MARFGLDFAAEGGHAAVHAAVGHDYVTAPDAIENRIAGEGPAAVLQEIFEQLELLRRQLNLAAVSKHLVRSQIEPASAKPVIRALGGAATEECFYSGEKFTNTERFRDIVVRPDFQATHDVVFLAFRCKH